VHTYLVTSKPVQKFDVRTHLTGINEKASNLRLCKASSGTGGADRGRFVHGGPRLPDVDDRVVT